MLAYIFWHWPRPDVARDEYETANRDFQVALHHHGPYALQAAMVWRIHGAPWLPSGLAYEDWYLLPGSAALDVLNECAVSPPVKPAHDVAAALAAGGIGGLYRTLGEPAAPPDSRTVQWFAKPAGMTYDDLTAALHTALPRLWRRMMVLGPAPEMCLMGTDSLPPAWEARTIERDPVWPAD